MTTKAQFSPAPSARIRRTPVHAKAIVKNGRRPPLSEDQSLEVPPTLEFDGELPAIDIRQIREALGLSRQEFAFRFGLSLRTIQNWEEGRRQPDGPAFSYLVAIKYAPQEIALAHRQYRGETG